MQTQMPTLAYEEGSTASQEEPSSREGVLTNRRGACYRKIIITRIKAVILILFFSLCLHSYLAIFIIMGAMKTRKIVTRTTT